MGVSTDAYLVYGISYGGECSGEWEHGLECDSKPGGTHEWFEALYDEAYVLAGCPMDRESDGPVGVLNHGSGEFHDYVVCVSGVTFGASRGYPVTCFTEGYTTDADHATWDADIRAFCEKHGLPYVQPRWVLVSYWG